MSGLTPEQIAVRICAATRRHDAGEGRHDAERYGPCDTHAEVAPVVAALIAEAVEQARAEERERVVNAPVVVGRMDAYYYTFKRTGVPTIDAILSAVAQAGKSYHHTESWANDDEYLSPSCEARIQAAADLAARIARGEVSP